MTSRLCPDSQQPLGAVFVLDLARGVSTPVHLPGQRSVITGQWLGGPQTNDTFFAYEATFTHFNRPTGHQMGRGWRSRAVSGGSSEAPRDPESRPVRN